MKIKYLLLLLAAASMAVTGCRRPDNSELAHDHAHEHSDHDKHDHEHEGHDHECEEHDHGDADEINLNPEVAERMGVKVTTVAPNPFSNVIKVSGVITASAEGTAMVAAPTSGIVTVVRGLNTGSTVGAGSTVATIKASNVSGGDVNKVAQAELEAARAEYERLKPLYAERLVTQARFNEAKAAYERAKAAYSAPAAAGRAAAPISGVITSLEVASGQYVEVGSPIATVSASAKLSLRAEVPARFNASLAGVTDARIVMPNSNVSATVSELGGHRIGNSSAAASAGYVPVTFTFDNNGTLVPGTAVEVYLIGGNSRQALTVPVSALSEQQGDYFVYQRLDEDCYRKLPVTVGESDGASVEILSGLKGGEEIVTEGVTTVRLAASAGAVPAGHTHSH